LQQQLARGRYERERGQISGPNLQLAHHDSAQRSPQRSSSSSTRSEQGKESEPTIVLTGRESGLSDLNAANDDEVEGKSDSTQGGPQSSVGTHIERKLYQIFDPISTLVGPPSRISDLKIMNNNPIVMETFGDVVVD
jgi:hypothetical protein